MQNRLEHKKLCGNQGVQPTPAVAGAGLPVRTPRCGRRYLAASPAETSFSETELMQKRWSVGVP